MSKGLTYWHMAFGALVNFVAWIDSSIGLTLKGDKYSKAYLFPQRDSVLNDQHMIDGLAKTETRPYHHWKGIWVRFIKVSMGHKGSLPPLLDKDAEGLVAYEPSPVRAETVGKYLAFVGVSAGLMVGFALGVVIASLVLAILGS